MKEITEGTVKKGGQNSYPKTPRPGAPRGQCHCVAVLHPNNCAAREHTADGVAGGRCWFWLGDNDTCERHGDVHKQQEHYRQTGESFSDTSHRAVQSTSANRSRRPRC